MQHPKFIRVAGQMFKLVDTPAVIRYQGVEYRLAAVRPEEFVLVIDVPEEDEPEVHRRIMKELDLNGINRDKVKISSGKYGTYYVFMVPFFKKKQLETNLELALGKDMLLDRGADWRYLPTKEKKKQVPFSTPPRVTPEEERPKPKPMFEDLDKPRGPGTVREFSFRGKK